MTNQIEEHKPRVIVLKDSSIIRITSQQSLAVEKAWKEGNVKVITVDNTPFDVNMIAKIIDFDTYASENPDKVPSNYHQPYSELPPIGFEGIIDKVKRKKDIEASMRGLMSFIESYRNEYKMEPINALKLLEKIKLKYDSIK